MMMDKYNNQPIAGNQINATSYNIRLKSNYFCAIQPQTLNELNVKLYGLTGAGPLTSFDLFRELMDQID